MESERCYCRAEYVCLVRENKEDCYLFQRMKKENKEKIQTVFKHDLFKYNQDEEINKEKI